MVFPNICTQLQTLDNLPVMVDVNCWKKADLLHFHNYTQLSYVLAGNMDFTQTESVHKLYSGSCSVSLPFVHHCLDTTPSDCTPIVVTISFNDDFLTDRGFDFYSHENKLACFNGCAIPHIRVFSAEEKLQTDQLIRNITEEFSKHYDMSFDMLATYIAEFLGILCTEPVTFHEDDNELAKEHATAINKSIRYMARHYASKITTADLCRVAAMSQSAYTRKFKELTSMTPIRFLNEVRLFQARNLLITTDMSIGEIAEHVGFYDKSHLIHAFTEIYGASPITSKNAFPQSFFDLYVETNADWDWLGNKNS